MLTEKDYCDKDTAFALQELGYNPYMFYDDGTPAIHLWYAQKWLREEKGIHLAINICKDEWFCNLVTEEKIIQLTYKGIVVKTFPSYEEALSEGIKEAVKILKNGLDC